jgi:hypothetical protein
MIAKGYEENCLKSAAENIDLCNPKSAKSFYMFCKIFAMTLHDTPNLLMAYAF